jgi:hypothetical protein
MASKEGLLPPSFEIIHFSSANCKPCSVKLNAFKSSQHQLFCSLSRRLLAHSQVDFSERRETNAESLQKGKMSCHALKIDATIDLQHAICVQLF